MDFYELFYFYFYFFLDVVYFNVEGVGIFVKMVYLVIIGDFGGLYLFELYIDNMVF